ncbi:MAG TPA: hypothetical protein VEH77_04895 [Roseiarcus sp.]|nr:hypothetical protein [Roseiarcus sp.]
MSSRHYLFVTGGRTVPCTAAASAEFVTHHVGGETASVVIDLQDDERIEITADQWRFLRGVYAMNPEAPPGLPSGDNAVLAQEGDDSNGLLFFVDGDEPCAPMHAPPSLLSLMKRVAPFENPRWQHLALVRAKRDEASLRCIRQEHDGDVTCGDGAA